MKVVFQDIDGVLNSRDDFTETSGVHVINKNMLQRLKKILDCTGAKVVLSSTWRFDSKGINIVRSNLQEIGHEIFSVTPNIDIFDRKTEIKTWLEDHPEVVLWVVLDDWPDADLGDGSFVRTHFDEGLTDFHVSKCIDILTGNSH